MEIIYFIVAIFISFSVVGLCFMGYEWVRHHSGLFKPLYTEEMIKEKVKFYESCLKYDGRRNQEDEDYYDYWLDQLKTMKRYKKIHRIS